MTDATAVDSTMRADRAERLLETLRARDPGEADLQASAMIMAGLKLLQEQRGTAAVLDALSRIGPVLAAECPAAPGAAVPLAPAPVTAPILAVPPDQLAMALVDQLRTLPRWEAHERARAVVAGAGAYLHATFGASYASAVTDGALQAATSYGIEHRGGRDTLDTLH